MLLVVDSVLFNYNIFVYVVKHLHIKHNYGKK